MDGKDKETFDALHALSEQVWRDWDHKSRYEWRLSFGVWGALLAACGAGLQRTVAIDLTYLVVAGIVLFALHVWFLAFIQIRLGHYKEEYNKLRARMPEVVRPPEPQRKKEAWAKSPSLLIQAGITALLVGVLFLIAKTNVPAAETPVGKKAGMECEENKSLAKQAGTFQLSQVRLWREDNGPTIG